MLRLGVVALCITASLCDYLEDREALVKKITETYVGSSLELTRIEAYANKVLMRLKNEELAKGMVDKSHFPPAMHFFKGKHLIEQSKVFKIIKRLPKGSFLFYHDIVGATSLDFYMKISYWPNLYGCFSKGTFKLHFFNGTTNDECEWTLLSDMRRLQPNFDVFLKSQLSLEVDDPEVAYPTVKSVWEKRQAVIEARKYLMSYRPVLETNIHECFDLHYKDNCRHGEVRCTFLPIYELDGTTYDTLESAKIYFAAFQKFVSKHPDHSGVIIYHPTDIVDDKSMDKHVEIFSILKDTYGPFVAGFELSSIGVSGKLISDFAPQILRLKEKGAQFFFHGPESNWYEKNVESNMVDSILLNATRVSYVATLSKNPAITDLLHSKKIVVEVDPIDNQVMKTVPNVMNHPAGAAFASSCNVVITPGYGGLWDISDLSYDWYMAFMAIADKKADLRFLKQLAMNSILSSAVDDETRSKLLKIWSSHWKKFVANQWLAGE